MTMYGKHGRMLSAAGALLALFAVSHGQSLTVDHTSIKRFDSIPARWLDSVKTMVIQIVGQSHGRQIPKGLELLEAQNAKYSVQIGTNPNQLTEAKALTVIRSYGNGSSWSSVVSVGDERYWSIENGRQRTETTAQQAISEKRPLRISLWCWCWDICSPNYCHNEAGDLMTFNDERCAAYVGAIQRFNKKIIATKFIYHTSVTDTRVNENGWRVTSYNDSIRAAAAKNNGILFDQADIENWNATNTQRRFDTWEGHTLYLRHPDYEETVGVAYADGHTNEALCIRKAKGLWYLLARIAGWDGGLVTGESGRVGASRTAGGTTDLQISHQASGGEDIRYRIDGMGKVPATLCIFSPVGKLIKEFTLNHSEGTLRWDEIGSGGAITGNGVFVYVVRERNGTVALRRQVIRY